VAGRVDLPRFDFDVRDGGYDLAFACLVSGVRRPFFGFDDEASTIFQNSRLGRPWPSRMLCSDRPRSKASFLGMLGSDFAGFISSFRLIFQAFLSRLRFSSWRFPP
jgi:hypothetical protein